MLIKIKDARYNSLQVGCIGSFGEEKIVVVSRGTGIVCHSYATTNLRDRILESLLDDWNKILVSATSVNRVLTNVLLQIKNDHYNPLVVDQISPIGKLQIGIVVCGIDPWTYDYTSVEERDQVLDNILIEWNLRLDYMVPFNPDSLEAMVGLREWRQTNKIELWATS
jgi:hypothetical protein